MSYFCAYLVDSIFLDCAGSSLLCTGFLSLIAVSGVTLRCGARLLIAVASLAVEHGL